MKDSWQQPCTHFAGSIFKREKLKNYHDLLFAWIWTGFQGGKNGEHVLLHGSYLFLDLLSLFLLCLGCSYQQQISLFQAVKNSMFLVSLTLMSNHFPHAYCMHPHLLTFSWIFTSVLPTGPGLMGSWELDKLRACSSRCSREAKACCSCSSPAWFISAWARSSWGSSWAKLTMEESGTSAWRLAKKLQHCSI